ncbi:MAG: zinc dependent phospholipase C family protein [Bacteroidales bacterium]|nr:zinc dependent phospholipase C family protein [Bacteroidales bacterium]
MKKVIFCILCSSVILFGSYTNRCLWGFASHEKINRNAVFTLPEKMLGFYKRNIDYLTTHATDPDKRSFVDDKEAPRHFINLEKFGEKSFDSIPKKWKDAVAKYSEDSLNKYGILPWHINLMLNKLTDAYKNNDSSEILYLSANIAHYIADACVPLHTTMFYNGKTTGEKGIHGFFETRIPEVESENIKFWVGRAEYIGNPANEIWKIIKESNAEVDTILKAYKKVNSEFPAENKTSIQKKGKKNVKVFSAEFSKEFSRQIDDMVDRRLQKAVYMVGCFWYTAWVNAGQPDLKNIQENQKK